MTPINFEKATFGGGCFWCTEAVFQRLNGVINLLPGYAGGHVKNPSYKEVCTGHTGHAEVVQVTFDPAVITYEALLEIFFYTHDPTTLNRQGNDIGTQYRSVIFYHNDNQRIIAMEVKARLEAEAVYSLPVVTEVSPLNIFYQAEDYHHNFYNQNSSQPYCSYVISPKLKKFQVKYAPITKP